MSALDRARALWGPKFRFLTAKDWGMTWVRPAVPEKLNDPEAYFHHSAGSRLGNDAVRAFQALNRWAQEGKKYSALDYDILVHLDKSSGLITIGEGRGEWMSAATRDRNEQGEAICLMGYFHPGHVLSEHPTLDEIRGVALAIAIGIERGWIARDARILGHRDNPAHPGATGCPGDWAYPYLPQIRVMVELLLATEPTPEPPSEEDEMLTVVRPPAQYPNYPFFALGAGSARYAVARDVARVQGTPDLYTETASRYANLFRGVYGGAPEDFKIVDGTVVPR